jgi:hypothetical protein
VASAVTAEPAVPVAAARSAPATSSPMTRSAAAGARDLRARTRLKSGGLEQRALAEEGWVIEDLRRIGIISAMILVGLALAWVLFVVVGLGDFY